MALPGAADQEGVGLSWQCQLQRPRDPGVGMDFLGQSERPPDGGPRLAGVGRAPYQRQDADCQKACPGGPGHELAHYPGIARCRTTVKNPTTRRYFRLRRC